MTIRSCFSSLKCWGNSQEQRGTMQERSLRVHSINSHPGFFSKHKYDWIILVTLMGTDFGLNFISPFRRFVGKDMMTDHKYPLKDNTVSFWYVWLYAVVFPYIVIVCFYVKRRCVYDLNYGILGLLYALLLTVVITDSFRLATGRPRPNFYWRCFPDGKELYDSLGNVICHGKEKRVKEGYKSFPSRHTSISFAGLSFLSLYLSGKIKAFNGEGHVAKLCIVVFPLLVACFTGISRVDDYWNHWSDVFAGVLIGLIASAFCYRQFYPNPNHEEGWAPYAYFKAAQEIEVYVTSQNRDTLRAMSLQMDSTSLHNIESGVVTAPR